MVEFNHEKSIFSKCQEVNITQYYCDAPMFIGLHLQGGPAKVRPTYIFDDNI